MTKALHNKIQANYESAAQIKTSSLRSHIVKAAIVSLCMVSCVFYWHITKADTNLAGVDIELLSDHELSQDPVKVLVDDIDRMQGDNSSIWSRIKDGYGMPDIQSEYTAKHEEWYSSRPDYVKRMVTRSEKYLFYIVEEVQKRNMPTEIALLPMIESGYNPQAYSRSRASGLWQFVPSTGKDFGLQQNWWVDHRRDVLAATDAALTYLQKLHGMFGSWDLALAAYNAGEGTVSRAIERNRKMGLPTDYQSLDLPIETKNYVPKLQAVKNIVTDPSHYGLAIDDIQNKPYFVKVTAPKQIDAKLAAKLAEISYEEFSALNPSYNRPMISSNGEVHQLLLPTSSADTFEQNLRIYDKPLSNWRTYLAQKGERIDEIARKFGINLNQFRHVNSLSGAKKIYTAQSLLVPADEANRNEIDAQVNDVVAPSAPEQHNADVRSEPKRFTPVTYKVKRGESLQAIADKYDVNVAQLKQMNRIHGSQIKAGQVIRVSMSSKSEESVSHKGSSRFNKMRVQSSSKHGHTTHATFKSKRAKSSTVSTRAHHRKHK